MNLRMAHGLNEEEIETYTKIITTNVFSIAEYKSNAKRKMSSFTHKHEAYEFIIPFNTIPLMHYENAIYIGEVGYCFPVNPNVMHGIEFDLDSNLIDIVIDMKYLDEIKKELGFENKYFYTRFLVSKELIKFIQIYVITKNEELIKKIVSTLINDGLSLDKDARKPDKKYFTNMNESIIYMMNNYLDPDLTIEDISKHSNYTYTYFTKAFKRYMSDTPINHLNKLRLSKAKELMKNKSLSLEQIAKMSGYKTQSNFSEAFKRIVGISPIEYRKKYL